MKKRASAFLLAACLLAAPAFLPAQNDVMADKEKAKEMKKSDHEHGHRPAVGEKFPELSGKSHDGKDIDLANFTGKGKVVLVDFWATWCGPCLGELPYLKAAYADLHEHGFEIVGVSLDSKDEAIAKFYKEPKTTLAWPSIYEGEGWKTSHAGRMGIRSIPASFLLDENGTVIATDLRGNQVYRTVAQKLGVDKEPPPDLHDLFAKFSKGDSNAVLQQQILKLAHQSQPEANGLVWEYLDDREDKPSKESAELAYQMLKPSIDENKDFAVLDTAALAAFYAGRPDEARTIQQSAVDAFVNAVQKQNPDVTIEQIAGSPGMTEALIRLGLYEAAAGDTDAAQKRLDAAIKNSTDPEVWKNDKYYKKAQKKLAKGGEKQKEG